jgi:hypothetical protein
VVRLSKKRVEVVALVSVLLILGVMGLFFIDSNDNLTGAAVGVDTIGSLAEANSTNCGTVNGDITLTTNISVRDSAEYLPCMDINASNIVFDCAGYSLNILDDTFSSVFSMASFDNVTIKSCNVESPVHGLATSDGSITVYNSTFIQSGGAFLMLDASSLGTVNISSNTITSSSYFPIYFSNAGPASQLILRNNLITYTADSGQAGSPQGTVYLTGRTILDNNTIINYALETCGVLLSSSNNIFTNNKINSTKAPAICFIDDSFTTPSNQTIDFTNLAKGFPIYYNKSLSNDVVFSNINLTNVYGQIICDNCTNVTYNNVTFGGDGLHLYRTNSSTIQNSKFHFNSSLSFLSSSDNLIDNNIFEVKNNYYALLLRSNPSNPNESFITTGNRVTNNIISSNGVSPNTLQLYGVSGNSFDNNTINSIGSFGSGISMFYHSTNNYINLTTINSNGYGFWFNAIYYSVPVNYITGGTINASEVDILVTAYNGFGGSSSKLRLLNVSMENAPIEGAGNVVRDINIQNNADDTVNASWYVNVEVQHTNGSSIEDAVINVTDVNGTLIDTKNTSSDGFLASPFILNELVALYQSDMLFAFYTPHLITATKSGYTTISSTVNLSRTNSTTVSIVLSDVTHNFNLTTPVNLSTYNSSSASYTFTVTNTGVNQDNYSIVLTNTNSADVASLNTSTLSGIASQGQASFTLTVGDSTVANYSATVEVTSAGNSSLSVSKAVMTEVVSSPPTVSISLVTPTASTNFNKNIFTTFTVNVSCSVANCGQINVSLDPYPVEAQVIAGCNPDANQCTATCDGLLKVGTGGTWSLIPFPCTSDNANGPSVTADGICDSYPWMGAGNGQCATVAPGGMISTCPSYERNSNTAVVAGDCGCFPGGCGSADTLFDLTHAFFAGAAGGVTAKTGLVNDTIGALPFYVNSSNPINISLNSGEYQTVTWYVNATANVSDTKHVFFAYANLSSNSSINAVTDTINITIFTSNTTGLTGCIAYDGDSSSCLAAGCIYNNFRGECFPDPSNFDCNTFCDICNSQAACGTSTKSCVWESDFSYCHEDYDNFEFGSGGSKMGDDWFDMVPPDCIANPTQCDSSFNSTFGYVEFEYSCFDLLDNDKDGNVDCDDEDCFYDFSCRSSYNATADTTAPQIKNIDSDADFDSANIQFVSSEPTTGKIHYYDINSTCNETKLNTTLITTAVPDLYHFIFLDSVNLDAALQNSTIYFYKVNITDQANNMYLSACLNFTTEASKKAFSFNFSGADTFDLQFDLGNGFMDYNSSTGLSANVTKDASLRFNNFGIHFGGVDLARAVSFDFTGAFNSSIVPAGDFAGRDFFKMDSAKWQQMKQQLGVDEFSMTMKSLGGNCDKINRCNDNSTTCVDVTSEVTCNVINETHVNVTADTFSSYIAGTSAELNISDDTDTTSKTTADTIIFYANYTNSTSGVAITGAACNITISTIGVSDLMTFNGSGNGEWQYSTSSFTSAGSFTWESRCNATNYDTLNTTDTVTVGAVAGADTGNGNPGGSSSSTGSDSAGSATAGKIPTDTNTPSEESPKIDTNEEAQPTTTEESPVMKEEIITETVEVKTNKLSVVKKWIKQSWNWLSAATVGVGLFIKVNREWLMAAILGIISLLLFYFYRRYWS